MLFLCCIEDFQDKQNYDFVGKFGNNAVCLCFSPHCDSPTSPFVLTGNVTEQYVLPPTDAEYFH